MVSATVTIEENLVADPELRFTQTGKAAWEVRMPASERRMPEAGEWQDTGPAHARTARSERTQR